MIVNPLSSTLEGSNKPKRAESGSNKNRQKGPCFTSDVQTKELTTATLAVPGVEVVTSPTGKAIGELFYTDELEMLRDALRGMRRRDRFEVTPEGLGYRIHQKS